MCYAASYSLVLDILNVCATLHHVLYLLYLTYRTGMCYAASCSLVLDILNTPKKRNVSNDVVTLFIPYLFPYDPRRTCFYPDPTQGHFASTPRRSPAAMSGEWEVDSITPGSMLLRTGWSVFTMTTFVGLCTFFETSDHIPRSSHISSTHGMGDAIGRDHMKPQFHRNEGNLSFSISVLRHTRLSR